MEKAKNCQSAIMFLKSQCGEELHWDLKKNPSSGRCFFVARGLNAPIYVPQNVAKLLAQKGNHFDELSYAEFATEQGTYIPCFFLDTYSRVTKL